MIIRMNLVGTTLSEINQKKKEKYYMILISLIWGIQTVKLIEAESRMVVARDWGKGDKRGVISQNFSYARWVSTRNLLYNTVPIVNNIVLETKKFAKRLDLMSIILIMTTLMTMIRRRRKRRSPAHLPDTRQLSLVTPARSSDWYSPAEPRDTCLQIFSVFITEYIHQL